MDKVQEPCDSEHLACPPIFNRQFLPGPSGVAQPRESHFKILDCSPKHDNTTAMSRAGSGEQKYVSTRRTKNSLPMYLIYFRLYSS
jgi:hypothetical protein